jgi:N-acetylneuraminate synthase/N,N'-diacetyllegionaminate synthase
MLRALCLREEDFFLLQNCALQNSIEFICTPFDCHSVNMLERLGVKTYKVGSGDVTNHPLLEHIGRMKCPVILSTGMSTLGEVEEALFVLRRAGATAITLLHCTSGYPTPMEDVNLRAMDTLRQAFGLPVGYSDHTLGFEVALAAVARGATVIEKHFTIDRSLPGPDQALSLEPNEFATMVKAIRNIERALGDGIKRVVPSEEDVRVAARRSICASRPIPAGSIITEDMLSFKRPGTGIPPSALRLVLGRRAQRFIDADCVIGWSDI